MTLTAMAMALWCCDELLDVIKKAVGLIDKRELEQYSVYL